MTAKGSLVTALFFYQIKRAMKNIYLILWLGAVTGSIVIVSRYWLPGVSLTHEEWALNSINSGMLGAFLVLPFVVRSFAPVFSVTGGVDFLSGRTRYIGVDTVLTLLINIIVLLLVGAGGACLAALWLQMPLPPLTILPTILLMILPFLLLLIAVIAVLLAFLPPFSAMIVFWLLLGALSFAPDFAPWSGLAILSLADVIPYSPLMLFNRLFCLLATGLLFYIYALVLKNQSLGLMNTRQRIKQAHQAEERSVFVAGRGLVLGSRPGWERLKKELKIMGFPRLLAGLAGAFGCGWLARTNEALGLAGIGVVILFSVAILSPYHNGDRLLSGRYRRKWRFIFLRTALALLWACFMIISFWALGPHSAANQVFWGFFVVWGWAWLCSHFWSALLVRVCASLFWMAMVFFPGALAMTSSNHWWFAGGILLILVAVILYRRNLYPE